MGSLPRRLPVHTGDALRKWARCGVILTAGLLGCAAGSSTVPVTGTVKQPNGEPLAGGRVFFRPTGAGIAAYGRTTDTGAFELSTIDGTSGAQPGVYKVVISAAVPAEALDDAAAVARYQAKVDQRFQSAKTTPFEFTVQDDGSPQHFDIVLK